MTSMPVEILPIAQEDVNQALAYIAADNPDASDQLLNDILEALQQASHFPYSGTEMIIGKRNPRRYYRLYVHPYHIYYRVIQDTIVVMRVLHERMDTRKHL